MYSAENNKCLHSLGSPIRKSPDHRLLASPRGLSQLATSFIAYLCQGIHTHALSSLTIKFTLNTEYLDKKPVARSQEPECNSQQPTTGHLSMRYQPPRSRQARRFLQLCSCPSNIQFSKIYDRFSAIGTNHILDDSC
jgi:hypothetical protein